MVEDAQQILQRALIGEALDCAAGTAVFVWNEERHYVAVNEEACRLVGLSRSELIGMPVGNLSPDHAAPEIESVRRSPLVRGTSSFTPSGGESVAVEWVTMQTRVAGLAYMVSLVWPAR